MCQSEHEHLHLQFYLFLNQFLGVCYFVEMLHPNFISNTHTYAQMFPLKIESYLVVHYVRLPVGHNIHFTTTIFSFSASLRHLHLQSCFLLNQFHRAWYSVLMLRFSALAPSSPMLCILSHCGYCCYYRNFHVSLSPPRTATDAQSVNVSNIRGCKEKQENKLCPPVSVPVVPRYRTIAQWHAVSH